MVVLLHDRTLLTGDSLPFQDNTPKWRSIRCWRRESTEPFREPRLISINVWILMDKWENQVWDCFLKVQIAEFVFPHKTAYISLAFFLEPCTSCPAKPRVHHVSSETRALPKTCQNRETQRKQINAGSMSCTSWKCDTKNTWGIITHIVLPPCFFYSWLVFHPSRATSNRWL